MAMTASRSRRVSKRTSVYVYGVTWVEGTSSRRGAGVGGADVGAVEHGDIAAVVSVVPDEPVRARRRDLMRHMDVLQHVFASATVLPLQFGSLFEDHDVVEQGLLAERYDELVDLLQRFDGLAELRIRASYREDVVLAEIVQGDARIARLNEQTRNAGARDPRRVQLGEAVARALAARRDRDARAIADALGPLAADTVVEDPRTELELLRASYLVEQRKIAAFDKRMDKLAAPERERIAFTYTGPLPPHSFVGLSHGRS
jgi:gas vesicle protein GvpL/GvpF